MKIKINGMAPLRKATKYVGDYTLNQVEYPSTSGRGNDIVCQVKQGREICHCTWHPDGNIHCKDGRGADMSPSDCPCYGSGECLR